MGMSWRIYTTHPHMQLGFSHFATLILGGEVTARFARQGLLFGTMGQGRLSVWAYTACNHVLRNISPRGCMAECTLIGLLYQLLNTHICHDYPSSETWGGEPHFSTFNINDLHLNVLRTFRRDRHPWRNPMKSVVEMTPRHCLERFLLGNPWS